MCHRTHPLTTPVRPGEQPPVPPFGALVLFHDATTCKAAIQAGCRRRADVLSALLANTWLLTTAYGRMFLPLGDTDIDEKVKHRAE